MSSLSQLPSDLKRKQLTKALERLGFVIDETGGNGSHYKAIWRNQKSVTLPCHFHKMALNYILKEIQAISGITWEEIKDNL